MHYLDLHPSLAAWIETVNDRLQSLLIGESTILFDAGTAVIGSRGKRLRPAMLLLSCAACGEVPDRAFTHAALIEIIHTASLVHDDVVDEADVRRGTPSAPARWGNKFSILLGDFLLARVFEQAVLDGDLTALRYLSGAATEMGRAVVRECSGALSIDADETVYQDVIWGKTASLFAAAAAVGGQVAGAAPDRQQALYRLGSAFGYAFQVADDLLNLQSTAEETGKPPGSDWLQRHATLPLLAAVQLGTPAIVRDIRALWQHDPLIGTQLADLLALVELAGGFEYGWRKVKQYQDEACTYLEHLPAGAGREALHHLCTDGFPLPVMPAMI